MQGSREFERNRRSSTPANPWVQLTYSVDSQAYLAKTIPLNIRFLRTFTEIQKPFTPANQWFELKHSANNRRYLDKTAAYGKFKSRVRVTFWAASLQVCRMYIVQVCVHRMLVPKSLTLPWNNQLTPHLFLPLPTFPQLGAAPGNLTRCNFFFRR